MTRKLNEDWTLVYDYQKTDNWDNQCVTVKIYNHSTDLASQAIVFDEVTKKTIRKLFFKETCESDAARWANDVAVKIIYGIIKK